MRTAMAAIGLLAVLATPATAQNRQAGDNTAWSEQSGTASSGDAIGGPSVGIHHRGDLRASITNRDGDASTTIDAPDGPGHRITELRTGPTDVASGDASGGNTGSGFVGLSASGASLGDVLGFPLEGWPRGLEPPTS